MVKRAGLLLALVTIVSGCGPNSAEESTPDTPDASEESASSSNPDVGYLGAVANAKKSMEGNLGVSQLQEAIRLYKVERERFPKDLDELIASGYIAKLPKAPYGMTYTYDQSSGVVTVGAE